jgi:excisionase family DNA binding protein
LIFRPACPEWRRILIILRILMGDEYFTTFQAAEMLSVSPDTILKWIKSNKLTAHRTPGGHYRISKKNIDSLLQDQERSGFSRGDKKKPKHYNFCWELINNSGTAPNKCSGCQVYKRRTKRCYEMRYLPKKFGQLKIFCASKCEDCDYYRMVYDKPYNILLITEKMISVENLDPEPLDSEFNLAVSNCEYECSAIVEKFRPDYAVIDCKINNCEDFCSHLSNDPRIPFVRLILATDKIDAREYCSNKIIGIINKEFEINDVFDCIQGILNT